MKNSTINFKKVLSVANSKLATPENAAKNDYTVRFSRKELAEFIPDSRISQTIDELRTYTVTSGDKTTDVLLFETVIYDNDELTLTYNNSIRKDLEPFFNSNELNRMISSYGVFMNQLADTANVTYETEEERVAAEAAKLEQFHKYEAMQMERYEKMHRNGQEDKKANDENLSMISLNYDLAK